MPNLAKVYTLFIIAVVYILIILTKFFSQKASNLFFFRCDPTQLLLRAKADVKLCTKTGGVTPLHVAAINGHTLAVKVLLEEGKAEPNAEQWQGRATPLNVAVKHNHIGVTWALLQASDTDNIGCIYLERYWLSKRDRK